MPFRRMIDIARVRQLLEQGLTQAQIARRLGFSESCVSSTVKTIKEVAK